MTHESNDQGLLLRQIEDPLVVVEPFACFDNNGKIVSGNAVLQVISIAEDRFEQYRTGADFIQRYIFPGGMLPTPAIFERESNNAGLRMVHADRFGASYARTLAMWSSSFDAAWSQVRALGYDERLRRMWQFYLAYCEAGFRVGAIDVGHYKLVHD